MSERTAGVEPATSSLVAITPNVRPEARVPVVNDDGGENELAGKRVVRVLHTIGASLLSAPAAGFEPSAPNNPRLPAREPFQRSDV